MIFTVFFPKMWMHKGRDAHGRTPCRTHLQIPTFLLFMVFWKKGMPKSS